MTTETDADIEARLRARYGWPDTWHLADGIPDPRVDDLPPEQYLAAKKALLTKSAQEAITRQHSQIFDRITAKYRKRNAT